MLLWKEATLLKVVMLGGVGMNILRPTRQFLPLEHLSLCHMSVQFVQIKAQSTNFCYAIPPIIFDRLSGRAATL